MHGPDQQISAARVRTAPAVPDRISLDDAADVSGGGRPDHRRDGVAGHRGATGQVERASWIVVSYLIAATIAAPIYGRLGDASAVAG